jgi:replicative DNA helicase
LKDFHLSDEFVDKISEQNLIKSISLDSALYWQLYDLLSTDIFIAEKNTWLQLLNTIETQQPLNTPEDWLPATDPEATARHLLDLFQRRLLVEIQERLATLIYQQKQPASEIISFLENEATRIQIAIKETQYGTLRWANEVLLEVLANAEETVSKREQTGKPVMGLATSIRTLDDILNGLNVGLYLLAGGPGMGKTSLAMQIASTVAKNHSVVYITFENSPANLVLKTIASQSEITSQQVQRGWANIALLHQTASKWLPVAHNIAFIEGNSNLTLTQIRARVLQAIHKSKSDKCLIVVDYLQLWAKASSELRSLNSVRERVEALGTSLREIAIRLNSPVLALASQNRSEGGYGTGKGKAVLDSLKESGDLEYAADVVMFLTGSEERIVSPPARAVDLTIAKNRDGDVGFVPLIFRPDLGIMREEQKYV